MLPIHDDNFWKKRINSNKNQIHRSVYDVDENQWKMIEKEHKKIIAKHIKKYQYRATNILDAGCGYGGLIDILDPKMKINYYGIDLSQSMIDEANKRYEKNYPEGFTLFFRQGDIRNLKQFTDNTIDFCIVRSLEGMLIETYGTEYWRECEQELLRVSKTLLLLNFSTPTEYKIYQSRNNLSLPNQYCYYENGFVLFRCDLVGNVEIVDYVIDPEKRKQGFGKNMIERFLTDRKQISTYAFVRRSNVASIKIFEHFGFVKYTIPQFYDNEDAFLFFKKY